MNHVPGFPPFAGERVDGAESSAFINAVKRRIEAIGPDTGVY